MPPKPDKPKKTKSRNGCITCKKKRLKCDETKPECHNCKNKKILCGGYATNFKWRSFNEDDKHKVTGSLKRHLELASLSMTGKSIKDIKRENELISQGLNPKQQSFQLTKVDVPEQIKKQRVGGDRRYSMGSKVVSSGAPLATATNVQRSSSDSYLHSPKAKINLLPKTNGSGALNSLAEAAVDEMNRSPRAEDNHNQHPHSDDFFLTPSISALINGAFNDDQAAAMSPLTLSSLDHDIKSEDSRSDRSDLDRIDESLGLTKILTSPCFSAASPAYSSSSFDSLSQRSLMQSSEEQQILYLYHQYTCSIMSIKNGVDENPWRNMIMPLASQYPCLYNSIASMTLFHLAGNAELRTTASNLRAKGYWFMKRCVIDLASGLSKSTGGEFSELPADIALTTCLNLAVSESWDTHISSGIAHLKGARSLIQKVLQMLKDLQQSLRGKRQKFLAASISHDEYANLLQEKKNSIQRQLVLLDNAEWEHMVDFDDQDMDGQQEGTGDGAPLALIPKSLSFLFNIWIYFEVLAQMTTESISDDKGIDLVASITTVLENTSSKKRDKKRISLGSDSTLPSPSIRSDSSGSESNYFGNRTASTPGVSNVFDNFETFANYSANSEYVDPLLGCSQSLFSIMGKVAGLICKIRKAHSDPLTRSKHNSLAIITAASQLKHQLLEWKPVITQAMLSQVEHGVFQSPGTWDISSCVATAEAYRFASLLYLHQAVPEVPSLSSHQLAEKIFVLMASIPTSSHLYVVHIFPLLISSCEAEPGDEREWCEARWKLLSEKMWIGNIDRAFEVVKEVWRRKDETRKDERRKSTEDVHLGQISGLMAVVNSRETDEEGICSRIHWSTVMKEWGWEVLLG